MIARLDRLLRVGTIVVACTASLDARAVVFSGEVRSDDAQTIFTPPSDSAPVALQFYVPDGTQVKPGDVLLRINAAQPAAELRTLDAQVEQANAKIAKEVADLKLKAVDAELALIDAQAALDTALVDSAIPKQLISALDYDRYQAESERCIKDAALKRQQLSDARGAVERRSDDGKLEIEKLRVKRSFDEIQVDAAEVRAERAGIVIHAFSIFSTGRFEEGSPSQPGQKVGEVVGSGAVSVHAWLLEPERASVKVGDQLRLTFDALPGRSAVGTVNAVSGASETKNEWGAGRYFTIDIGVPHDATASLPLKSGMSVRAETLADATSDTKTPARNTGASGNAVSASGEVFARSTSAISPPEVEDLWTMTITQMAADGQVVKKGDSVVTFDGGEVTKQLGAKQSELEEKIRQQEKSRLELDEKAHTETVATAEARAEAVKARRKASQPEAVVPGVQYKKLMIARAKAEQHEVVSERREQVAAGERGAEQRAADADVTRLTADVARLQASVAALNIAAPRDGIFLHSTNFNGEKIDVGTQVWRGRSVADIPDMSTLAVRASLAERDLSRVQKGADVRVVLEGGSGQSLTGHLENIGISVHSKSRFEPVPVVDLQIVLDATKTTLKPGQPVRVEFVDNAAKGSAR